MSSSSQQAQAPSSVIAESQWAQLNQLTSALNREQLTWVSGYLAGLAVNQAEVAITPVLATEAQHDKKLTLLVGSQTGNAKGVAEAYAAAWRAAGIAVELKNMADYKPKQLKSESHIVVVVSTHGEGDAPDDAVALYEFLESKKAPRLDNLQYAVVGLGDSSYEFFCQTAKDFDQRLAALGATSMAERLDCDVEYEEASTVWGKALLTTLEKTLKPQGHSQVVPLPGLVQNAQTTDITYTKSHPFEAEILTVQKITGRDSGKDIRHIELSLEDSGIHYQPGDVLGVWFENTPSLVDELLGLLNLAGNETVEIKGQAYSVRQALAEKCELTLSYPTFVKAYYKLTELDALSTLVSDTTALRHYLEGRQIIDIVRENPASVSAQAFVDTLRPLTPRMYSIASSQKEVDDEVHLTVALVEYDAFGYQHTGGASGYLCKQLEEGQSVKIFVESNAHFRLPSDTSTPIIMVGPGTGIAPFRAFMQEREATQATGENWLFFGNPHYTQDFLYQTEWQQFVKDDVLTKMTLAFSRDQAQKVYVQHKLREHGNEVYRWLENGAHFYVCGDASQMAKDVEQALIDIVSVHGDKSVEEAKAFITELRKSKRYQKDVY